MSDELFRHLYPLPKGYSSRRPRFGKASSPPMVALPPAGELADSSGRERFKQIWKDEELGLTVIAKELDAGVVTVDVDSTNPRHLGNAVSVALTGRQEGQFKRVTVYLATELDGGCCGSADLGRLAELEATIGHECTIIAFLLEAGEGNDKL
jgi:hypothetical protein